MALLQFEGVGIAAIAACIPQKVINNYEYADHFPKEMVREVVDKVGIFERRFVDEKTCSSDLCFAAAEKLIADNNVDKSEIDLLIFISQTPDFRMPATAIILQERLQLSNSCVAFDISLGCSVFIYGLSVAFSMMQNANIRKALILDGETRSKVYNPKDRTTAFLFGDGGAAALIERNAKYGKSYFSLNSDGSREGLIKIDGGGYRNMSSVETLKERVVDEHGNVRSMENGYMQGGDVFNFVIREIPRDVKRLLEYSGEDIAAMDYYLFHQANNFMNDYLIKKLKIEKSKVPSTISKYGNTSSVSLPLTLTSELCGKLSGHHKLFLSAFGVGLSWATAIIEVDNCKVSEIVEI